MRTLNDLDHKVVNGVSGIDSQIEENLMHASSKVWQTMALKESILRQKSMHKWIKEGDSNSKFLHKSKFRRNKIVGFNTISRWIE